MPEEKGETEKAKMKAQTKPKNPYPEPVEYLRFEASETLKPKSTKVTGQKKSASDTEQVKE